MNEDFGKFLSSVISAKFGPGALGRIGTIGISGLVVIAALAAVFAFVNIYIAGMLVFADIALAFLMVFKSFDYANKFPEHAAMDGAQISRALTHQGSVKPLKGLPGSPPFTTETLQNPIIEMKVEKE